MGTHSVASTNRHRAWPVPTGTEHGQYQQAHTAWLVPTGTQWLVPTGTYSAASTDRHTAGSTNRHVQRGLYRQAHRVTITAAPAAGSTWGFQGIGAERDARATRCVLHMRESHDIASQPRHCACFK